MQEIALSATIGYAYWRIDPYRSERYEVKQGVLSDGGEVAVVSMAERIVVTPVRSRPTSRELIDLMRDGLGEDWTVVEVG